MKIIILGAGRVASSVAANLANEANDITVIDNNSEALKTLSERYDLRIILGMASHPSVLLQAGGNDADMIIALTNNDEINMIACQVAYTLFHTPTKIARVRNTEYLNNPSLFAQEALPIDVLISPEQVVTEYIEHLIHYPGSLQVLDFANGKAQMVAIKTFYGSTLVGCKISELARRLPGIDYRVVMIFRKDKPVVPNGRTVIQSDDEIFFVGSRKNIRQLSQIIGGKERAVKSIMIAGGGQIGVRLALALERNFKVKLIEIDPERSLHASEELKNTIVLHGDAVDKELLFNENIGHTDVFCALTNADEANIISSMLAKHLGVKKVITLINYAAYVDLVQSNVIDIIISPQQTTIGSLLAHIRKGDIVVVHALRRGAAEAIEAIAHGDKNSSNVVGRMVKDIALPPGTTIGALVRGDEVLIAHDRIEIESEDHLILFVANKKYVTEVERLFQVGITFF